MPATFACPHCDKPFRIHRADVGKIVVCPTCLQATRVPAAAAAQVPKAVLANGATGDARRATLVVQPPSPVAAPADVVADVRKPPMVAGPTQSSPLPVAAFVAASPALSPTVAPLQAQPVLIAFSCPVCQYHYKIPPVMVGQKIECMGCSQSLRVPDLFRPLPTPTTVLGKLDEPPRPAQYQSPPEQNQTPVRVSAYARAIWNAFRKIVAQRRERPAHAVLLAAAAVVTVGLLSACLWLGHGYFFAYSVESLHAAAQSDAGYNKLRGQTVTVSGRAAGAPSILPRSRPGFTTGEGFYNQIMMDAMNQNPVDPGTIIIILASSTGATVDIRFRRPANQPFSASLLSRCRAIQSGQTVRVRGIFEGGRGDLRLAGQDVLWP